MISQFLPPAYVVRREGNSFTLFVSPHLGEGGYPYPIMLCNITHNAMGQTPGRGTLPGPGGGIPCQFQPAVPCWWGTLPGGTLLGRYLPGGVPYQGVPCQGGTQVGYPRPVTPPSQVRMGGYPLRTTEGVLTTRRAVCLLRSRRRTFLFKVKLAQTQKN